MSVIAPTEVQGLSHSCNFLMTPALLPAPVSNPSTHACIADPGHQSPCTMQAERMMSSGPKPHTQDQLSRESQPLDPLPQVGSLDKEDLPQTHMPPEPQSSSTTQQELESSEAVPYLLPALPSCVLTWSRSHVAPVINAYPEQEPQHPWPTRLVSSCTLASLHACRALLAQQKEPQNRGNGTRVGSVARPSCSYAT